MNNDDSDNKNFLFALRGLKKTINESETNSIMDDPYDRLKFNILKSDLEAENNNLTKAVPSISSINPKLKGIESVIEFLKKTGHFTQKELEIMRKINFFKESTSGKVSAHGPKFNQNFALTGLGALCVVGGVWAGFVIFNQNPHPIVILHSYLVGVALGFAGIFIYNNSFACAKFLDKIKKTAPWLLEQNLFA